MQNTQNTIDEFIDIKELFKKLENSTVPDDLKLEALKMLTRLYNSAKRGGYSTEYELIAKYIDWIVRIPWGKYSKDVIDLKRVEEELNKTHYGLTKVKKQILSYIAVLKLRQIQNGMAGKDTSLADIEQQNAVGRLPVLCFVGLQGLGKTTIAMSIARAMGRRFQKISMAAFGDILQLRGKPKTYPDAEPGVIVKALVRAGTMNPVILLDEIDKASGIESLRNDIYAALLEILDPTQNTDFVDRYIDYPIDLSKVFFITTANTLGTISIALLDRLEIIRFTSYTDEEKIKIGKEYLLPKVLKQSGLKPGQLIIDEKAWPLIVRPMGFDAGIRQLERTLTSLGRKVAYDILVNKVKQVKITPENVKKYLPEDVGVLG